MKIKSLVFLFFILINLSIPILASASETNQRRNKNIEYYPPTYINMRASVSKTDRQRNKNIEHYPPAYIKVSDLYTNRYYDVIYGTISYEIKLINNADVRPEPWPTSGYRFLGYTNDNTEVALTETSDTRLRFPKDLVKVPLAPGIYTINNVETNAYGKTNVTITIKEGVLPITTTDSGIFQNSYEDADVFIINFKINH